MKITNKYVFYSSKEDYLNDSYKANFKYKDINFHSTTQFLAYCQAKSINDNERAEEILNTKDIKLINKIRGRIHHSSTKEQKLHWKEKRESYHFIATREKFLQNQKLQEKLLASGDRKFIYAVDGDKFFSAGININSNKLYLKSQWEGKNKSGETLTYIRDQIKLGNLHNLKQKNQDIIDKKEKQIKNKERKETLNNLSKVIMTDKYVFFSDGYQYPSRAYGANFKYKDITFNNTIQFMAYCKSKIIGNEDISNKILQERNIRELIKIDKNLSSKMSEKERKLWKSKREKYAFIATREKFLQNPELQSELLTSGDRLFVEATDFEHYWSAGVNMNSHDLEVKSKWKGKNTQGQILTYIRDQIKLGNIQALNTQETLSEKKIKERKLKVR